MRLVLSLAVCIAGMLPFASAQTKKEKKDPPKIDGRLIVEDGAGFFSPESIKRAKSALSEVHDIYRREMQVMTLRELSETKAKEFEKLTDTPAKERFFSELANEEAKAAKARGVFVLVCRKPAHLTVLADKEIRDKGFAGADEQRVRDILIERFRAGSKLEKEVDKRSEFDKGLINAAEYVRDAYKKMVK
jgi:hypothetical protein